MPSLNKDLVQSELHITRESRTLYTIPEAFITDRGTVLLSTFHATRTFAQKMNDKRDLVRFPEKTVKSGQINGMVLINEILRYVFRLYSEDENQSMLEQAYNAVESKLGHEALNSILLNYVDRYPPQAVFFGSRTPAEYLISKTGDYENRFLVFEDILMLWLENANPAFSPYRELFDDSATQKKTLYREAISAIRDYFETQRPFGPDNQNLIDMLRSPAIAVPHSITGQLEYIREKWSSLLGKYLYRLLSSLDLIREETKSRFFGPGEATVFDYSAYDIESERYSMDKDWMPRVVIIAKSTYVWLDQLSKKYQRDIHRLDQIPDEELDRLARWGFTGLWLIGLWERSKASKRIKQLCGNPEAVASAYSLLDYIIADELGGEEAFENLRRRAWERGIRMAGDMVPNHVGIDGKWVIEHPDWFVALDYCPFPSHSFNGENLSWDNRVGIYIEDHYFNRTDAGPLFKRVDHWTGQVKYVYHGNDGTSMPWNDTAQLNYLNPEVREAVIQTILHVAHKFPIIRFDAAMTLTKRHYQRLWFPQPGTGGDIPSRAEHGLDKNAFDNAMPEEFWREVVDRVAQEEPDTLLLAEAFWLMEGYFVRTLGMHRVYNSAFMNMLKNEDNAKYRTSVKNVLEFDPEILKRFVNFMNNPDEDTAIAQFGKDDKYFGVCMMMITMPGLPMFGHGQVEGFTEKYGMEYRRAYWDEHPDEHLVRRHEREIFPLMHRRHLFAHVHNFVLYDFFTPEGPVNEDVFAYSNRAGNERGLVIYHNRYAETRGWIRTSTAISVKTGADERTLLQKNLGEGLQIPFDNQSYCIFRDHVSNLEYIRNCKELHEKGLYVEIGAYKFHVFLDFRIVKDNEWHHYGHLASFLNGRGVPNMEEALKETFLQPIHHPFKELVNASHFKKLMEARATKAAAVAEPQLVAETMAHIEHLLNEIRNFSQGKGDSQSILKQLKQELQSSLTLPIWRKLQPKNSPVVFKYLVDKLAELPDVWAILSSWWAVHLLGGITDLENSADQSRTWIDEWLFGKVMAGAFSDMEHDEAESWRMVTLVKIITTHQQWYAAKPKTKEENWYHALNTLLKDDDVQQYIQVNRFQDVLYFNKESFDSLLWWLLMIAVVQIAADITVSKQEARDRMARCHDIIQQLHNAEAKSKYQVEKLLNG
ncbi:alpha-amylase [candidate division KSB1 bacterium]|nr:alpha-amylase [candidate division KSB1 bacterium]